MEKLLLVICTIVLFTSCGYKAINGIPLEKGNTMTYETKDYFIIYELDCFNGFGQPSWTLKEIRNKDDLSRRDSL